MKVRVNSLYRFNPCAWDKFDPPYGVTDGTLLEGSVVRVKNLHGCPKANTMGHCHVVDAVTGAFLGLVSTASLDRV